MEKVNYRIAAMFGGFDNLPHQSRRTMASLWLLFLIMIANESDLWVEGFLQMFSHK